MAGAYPRKGTRKWTGWYRDATGKKRQFTGSVNKAETERMAHALDAEQRKIEMGIVDAGDVRRREASKVPLEEHADAFRDSILDGGGSKVYADGRRATVLRILKDAGISSISDLPVDAIQSAIGRLKAKRSARTANDALGAIKQFTTWLEDTSRIKEAPRALNLIRRFNEESDRKRVRRALTPEEVAKLLVAAETGPTLDREAPKIPRVKGKRGGWGQKGRGRLVPITGMQRATLYRLALGTGFRANELRSLTPESFQLDADPPTVTLSAKVTKNGKPAVQPILPELAAWLKPVIAAISPGQKVMPVPEKTADLIRMDLKAAGVPYETSEGVADFHCTRHTFITRLVMSGANIKAAQQLARHSTATLTLDRYSHVGASDVIEALKRSGEGGKGE